MRLASPVSLLLWAVLFGCTPSGEVRPNWVAQTLAGLSREEKAGQVLMVYFSSLPGDVSSQREMNPAMRRVMEAIKPGGVLFFGDNFFTASQTKKLTADLQGLSEIPLFLAADEEGGRVARLGRKPAMEVPHLPSARTLGVQGEAVVEDTARDLGKAMKSLGLNMNLGPVADLDTLPGNPLGNRSFSSNPETAGILAAAFIRGIQSEGIIAVAKHFPGLGMVDQDPHFGIPVWNWDQERFDRQEGVAFRAAAGAGGFMIAHLEIRGLEPQPTLAPWSPLLLGGLLRTTWNYQGLVMTDALNMGAAQGEGPSGEETVRALLAGADIILMPPDPRGAIKAVVKALETGHLPLEVLDRAVVRILKIKSAFYKTTAEQF